MPAESKFLLVVLIDGIETKAFTRPIVAYQIPEGGFICCVWLDVVHTCSLKGIWLFSSSCGKCWSAQHLQKQCLKAWVITREELDRDWDWCSGETLSPYLQIYQKAKGGLYGVSLGGVIFQGLALREESRT